MIVADASAIVAMIVGEPDAADLYVRLDARSPDERFVSTVSIWEASCAVARLKSCGRRVGLDIVQEFVGPSGLRPVAPDMTITALAIEAADRFGMGAGYPGILNLGDCFSYATARHLGAALLCKGGDFARTDIAIA